MQDIREATLKPDHGVELAFSLGRIKNAQWLIMRVSGDYGIGSRGNPNGGWMSGVSSRRELSLGLNRVECVQPTL